MQSLGQSGGRVQWRKATIVHYMFQNVVAVSVKGKRPWLSWCNGERWEGFGIQFLLCLRKGVWGLFAKKTHGPKAPGNGIKNVRSKLSLGHRAQPNNNPHSKSVHGRGISYLGAWPRPMTNDMSKLWKNWWIFEVLRKVKQNWNRTLILLKY